MSARMMLHFVPLFLVSVAFAEGPYRAPSAVAPPSRAPSTQITPPVQPTVQPTDVAIPASEARNSMSERLRSALMDVKPQLGQLQPWQEQIFVEEAATQPQRFIKNYTGSSADVDFDALKNFMRFHAPEILRRIDGKVLGLVKIDGTCAKCIENKDTIKTMLSERIRRRGLEITWLTTEDLTAPALPQRDLEDKLVALTSSAPGGPVGSISIHLRTAPIDDIDTAHADEKRLQVLTFLYMKDPNGKELSRNSGKLEVFDTEPLDLVSGRLLTDAFTDLGFRQAKFEQDIATAGKAEIEIEVIGIRGYELYSQVQAALSRSLKEEGTVEPRKIARGKAVFAIVTSKPAEKIKSQLGNLRVESSVLHMRGVSSQTIQMELK